ncbi:MAG: hypothetical protein HYZ26_00730 [Chloroflexi bacterium]|nr:hypothetical protein [Chloroflexota bacterium]
MRQGNFTGSLQVREKARQESIYVSSIGRFAQADVLVPGAGNPQNFNRYSYSYNNPIVFVDNSGHSGCPADPNDSFLGQAPDCRGISRAVEMVKKGVPIQIVGAYGTLSVDATAVAAGIAVQSQYQSDTGEFFQQLFFDTSNSGLGPAQVSD